MNPVRNLQQFLPADQRQQFVVVSRRSLPLAALAVGILGIGVGMSGTVLPAITRAAPWGIHGGFVIALVLAAGIRRVERKALDSANLSQPD